MASYEPPIYVAFQINISNRQRELFTRIVMDNTTHCRVRSLADSTILIGTQNSAG